MIEGTGVWLSRVGFLAFWLGVVFCSCFRVDQLCCPGWRMGLPYTRSHTLPLHLHLLVLTIAVVLRPSVSILYQPLSTSCFVVAVHLHPPVLRFSTIVRWLKPCYSPRTFCWLFAGAVAGHSTRCQPSQLGAVGQRALNSGLPTSCSLRLTRHVACFHHFTCAPALPLHPPTFLLSSLSSLLSSLGVRKLQSHHSTSRRLSTLVCSATSYRYISPHSFSGWKVSFTTCSALRSSSTSRSPLSSTLLVRKLPLRYNI